MSASCVPAVRFSDCSLRGGTAAPVVQMVWQAGFAGLETLVVGGWELVVGSWAVTSICYLPFWGFCIPFLFFPFCCWWCGSRGVEGAVFIYTWFFCMWERMCGGFEVYWFLDK